MMMLMQLTTSLETCLRFTEFSSRAFSHEHKIQPFFLFRTDSVIEFGLMAHLSLYTTQQDTLPLLL